MTHSIYAVTLMLFATTHHANAAQNPTTKARTEQDKRDSDAAEYRRRIAALGGKMLHLDEEEQAPAQKKDTPKITHTPVIKTDVLSRL